VAEEFYVKLLRSILSDLLTFLLSLMLAVLVWMNAVQENDPVSLQSFQVPLTFIGQPDRSTLRVNTDAVFLIIEGRASRLRELTTDDFSALIDLSQVPVGEDVVVDVTVQSTAADVEIAAPSPSQIDVRLEQLVTRQVPVVLDIRGSVARGHTQGEPLIDPQQITVVGDEEQVSRLESARVTVFLNNVRDTTVSSPVPIFYDRQGRVASTSGLSSVSHEEVKVTVPVEESADFAEKIIDVTWQGTPADGYRLLSINVEPPSVLVQGLPTILNEVSRVRTDAIDITGLTESFTQQVALDLPAGVSLDEVQVVLVTVEIEPILTTGVYNRPVEVIGLTRTLTATVAQEEVRVVVFGPLPVLDSLTEEEVRVTVDVFGLLTGTYSLEPAVILPDRGIELRSIQPPQVVVTVTTAVTTPTPTDLTGSLRNGRLLPAAKTTTPQQIQHPAAVAALLFPYSVTTNRKGRTD
jgi:YbbR domain-containing protein